MRVAALYDVHGNVPALEAVLGEVERENPDAIVFGGDIASGPFPQETIELVRSLSGARFVRGNADRFELPAPDPEAEAAVRWVREQLDDEAVAWLAALPETVTLELDGLGPTLFCHATPRSDLEIVTEATPDEKLLELVEGVDEGVIVSGHTHMQLDRRLDGVRWVNAGSIGMPYEGEVAAFWALLGPDVELRRTPIDVERTAAAILESGWPRAEGFVEENVRTAVGREEVVPLFERMARERGER
jgi:putative phosphoesterase